MFKRGIEGGIAVIVILDALFFKDPW